MADSRRPKPVAVPPLPRLWKAEPEPEPVVAPPSPRKKRKDERAEAKAVAAAKAASKKGKKKKVADPGGDDGTGAGKLAETPVLDTYEARQRARWIIGGVLASVGLVALIFVVRAFKGPSEELPRETVESHETRAPDPSRARAETEAHILVENARQADKAGKTKAAIELLNKAAKNYQNTPSARAAMEALDRDRRKLSLFGTDNTEAPTGPRPPKPAPEIALAPTATAAKSAGTPGPVAPSPPPVEPDRPKPPATTGDVARIDPTNPSNSGTSGAKVLPSGFRALAGAPFHASGWPSRIVCDRDGAVMILIPGARFLMGREDGEPAERPAHSVLVSTYYIDQHEVTVRQYAQFLRETGRPLDPSRIAAKNAPDPSGLPVVNINAREAREYCHWANRRLPTEAQWELAARAPEGRISYWNGEPPRPIPAKGGPTVEPILTLPSDLSPYGVQDMGGNAWEWTGDYFDSQYYQQVRKGVSDPVGPPTSRVKPPQVTVKGGSKTGVLTWREGVRIESRLPYLGFRGVLPVEGAPVTPVAPTTPNGVPPADGQVPPF